MLTAALLTLFALALAPALVINLPLGSSYHQKGGVIFGRQDSTGWDLNKVPNPNDTDHLVFETVHSLLQQWPNTRMRNGHNIVPGIIPKGTLLYHGAKDNALPPGPEWVSTDPEHSYLFCRDGLLSDAFQQVEECLHLTLVTTRVLKVEYFDGSSAAKMPCGSTDTQDLLAWGKAIPDVVFDDLRIEELCKWGNGIGVDGFVRMEMDFEIMLCDFTSGVSIVSFENIVGWKGIPPNRPPSVWFGVMDSGSWHNYFPGETRIQLDLAGLVSFYDTQLVPSLAAIRAGQERWDHRVRDISNEDWSTVRSELEAALVRPEGLSSGINWKTLIQVIVDRFAGRLELVRHLLHSSATDPNGILDLAKRTQTQLRVMLTPYILISAMPTSDPMDFDWTIPIYKLCALTHTHSMELELDSMTNSERLLLRAIRGTSREICRVVTKMWAAGVYAGIDQSLSVMEFPNITEVNRVRDTWTEELNRLMGWLDWNVWVKCNPECGLEEMCYLPTWPVGFPWQPRSLVDSHRPLQEDEERCRSRFVPVQGLAEEDVVILESDEWMRPQPKCIRRLPPTHILIPSQH